MQLFSGKKEIEAGEDGPEEMYLGLACGEPERVANFNLTQDDPGNFTDKNTFLNLHKYLPEPYPEGADSDVYPVRGQQLQQILVRVRRSSLSWMRLPRP